MKWHFIQGSPQRMWALYKNKQQLKTPAFNTDLLGWIERIEDGSWNCFAPNFCGNEPNRDFAADKVLNELLLLKVRAK